MAETTPPDDEKSTGISGNHPGSENLRPWPKGVSGNPNGRPSRKPFKKALKRYLRQSLADLEKAGADRSKVTGYQFLALQAITFAGKGNARYWQQIVDRIDGPIPQVKVEPATEATNDTAPLPPNIADAMTRAAMAELEEEQE